MGTSSSYSAPTSGGWPTAKGVATRFARQGGLSPGPSSVQPQQVTGAYVAAHGGATSAAATAAFGQSAAQALGGFYSGVASGGLAAGLQQIGLGGLVGSDAMSLLSSLVDRLAGPGRTLDEADARTAMLAVLQREFGDAETFSDLEALYANGLDSDAVMGITEQFIVEYIYARMVQELGKQLQDGALTTADACRVERDLQAFIAATVKLEMARTDALTLDWNGPAGRQFVAGLLEAAYGQLGA
jgi:hypothetical protein